MKGGADNRKKTILAGVLGTIALGAVGYTLVSELGGGSTPPPASAAPVAGASSAPAPTASSSLSQPAEAIKSTSSNSGTGTGNAQASNNAGQGPVPGVDATLIAKTKTSLDPTLDETAMLRTERLVYSGAGRNIFSLVYTPPAATIPKVTPPVRPTPPPVPGPPRQSGPPPLPPIPLKFFGTIGAGRGSSAPLRAFLLNGDDVYLASQGDIVAHKFKIDAINPANIQVEDLTNHNKQTLPLQIQ